MKSRKRDIVDDLTSMPIDELWSLHEELVLLLSSKILEEKRQLERKLSQLEAAPTVRAPARRPYPPVQPKFRNPMQPCETWAGRGKQPRWLSAQLRTGKQLDDFRIRAS